MNTQNAHKWERPIAVVIGLGRLWAGTEADASSRGYWSDKWQDIW